MGAPIVFLWYDGNLQWWRQASRFPEQVESIPESSIADFFQSHRREFAPHAVYRAKTWGRFASSYQLTFVDVGLMPLVESEIGAELSGLVERAVVELKSALRPKTLTLPLGQWILKSTFWLLAAKILKDKAVPAFASLDLSDPESVFECVAHHYGGAESIPIPNKLKREALLAASETIRPFARLTHVTTESLAHVYENALITRETRSKLGTHSTPPYLVDRVVWQLGDWLKDIPEDERNVFEPACGHAAFLVSAMRHLRELLPDEIKNDPQRKMAYLRKRLHGIECDPFALEIARLSLTLADIPNPDGWDLSSADMFLGDTLEHAAKNATVLLANAPFEQFDKKERTAYSNQNVDLRYGNKTAEMLGRTLSNLRPGSVVGIVVPQGLLHSRNATDLRESLATQFELREICLFPDKVFTFSDMESAVIVGRKLKPRQIPKGRLYYRRVRERGMEAFKETYSPTTERQISQSRFSEGNAWDMRVPDLEEIWLWCSRYPRLRGSVDTGQGLSYKGQGKSPAGGKTISTSPFAGSVKGYARLKPELQIHDQPTEVWMSLDSRVLRRKHSGTMTRIPQVITNYAPVSRGPWRLKAFLDREGHAITSRFLAFRPTSTDCDLEYLWALLNSPVANAYVYAHSMKRDVLVGMMRELPIPAAERTDIQRVVDAVRAYLEVASRCSIRNLENQTESEARAILLDIDAKILRLYDLPPRFERQILDLFAGWQRPGVPFKFERYYPEGYEPCFPLHDYLSEEYQRSTAGRLRSDPRSEMAPEMLAALARAVEDFSD